MRDGLILAILAAILAIAIETFLNLLPRDHVARQARELVQAKSLTVDPVVLQDFASGAISVARLGPTGMSVLTAIFAILHDQVPNFCLPFWGVYGAVIALICIGALLLRGINRRNFYAIATEDVRTFLGFGLHVTYEEVNVYWIYVLNSLVAAVCGYFLWIGELPHT
jgi:hypothetical protein